MSEAEERRKKALPYIIKGLREGKTGREILEELRKHGLGYRMQDFYADLRRLKGEMYKWDTMRFVPKDKVISDKLYAQGLWEIKSKYLTIFKARIQNRETGEVVEKYVSVAHDYPMKRKDLEEEAARTIEEESEEYVGAPKPLIKIFELVPVMGFKK